MKRLGRNNVFRSQLIACVASAWQTRPLEMAKSVIEEALRQAEATLVSKHCLHHGRPTGSCPPENGITTRTLKYLHTTSTT